MSPAPIQMFHMQPLVPALVGAHRIGGTPAWGRQLLQGTGRFSAQAAGAKTESVYMSFSPLRRSCTEGFQTAQKKVSW